MSSSNCYHLMFQAMPGCISFKSVVLEHEDMMRIMFDAISVTNETSYVPRSGLDDGEGEEQEAGHDDGDSERVEGRGSPHVTPNANKRPAQGFPSGKKTYRDQLMKRLVHI